MQVARLQRTPSECLLTNTFNKNGEVYMQKNLRIVKVGGSLLELPDLSRRIASWLQLQPAACYLFICGGGNRVDEMRMQTTSHRLTESDVHWKCIEIMAENARIMESVIPGAQVTESLSSFASASKFDLFIFAPTQWLRELEPTFPGRRLRECWDVTSDSIAARVTICLNAAELILLKSSEPPSTDPTKLADCGYVDRMFPELAEELKTIRMINLRQDAYA